MLQFNLCIIQALQTHFSKAITHLGLLYNQHPRLDSQIIQAIGYCLLKMHRIDDFLALYKSNASLFEARAYLEIASLLIKREQLKCKADEESSLDRRLRLAFQKNHKNRASLPSLLNKQNKQKLTKPQLKLDSIRQTNRGKTQKQEKELKRYVKEFRALTAKGFAQTCSLKLFIRNLDDFVERELYGADANDRKVKLSQEELEVLRNSLKRKAFLSTRELGVIDKMLMHFALFFGQESSLRKVIFEISRYRVVSSGRKIGEAMMAVSSQQFDSEIAQMLGDQILENQERLAYVLISGEVLYCVRKTNHKYVMLETVQPGNLFFSHPRSIERKLVGSSLQYYTELKSQLKGGGTLCALAKSKCELLEIDIERYKEESGSVLKVEVRERIAALRKNPLLGQLSHECLLNLAFIARVQQIHYGQFIVKQKQPQRECVLVVKGSCDVVYANVLDSGTLCDFRKYSDGRTISSRDVPHSSSTKRTKSNNSIRIQRPSEPDQDQTEDWKRKLRFTFWDNEKKGQLGQGDSTGSSCFISEGNQGHQAPLFQFIPLHPETTTKYSLIGSSTAVKVLRITPDQLMGIEPYAQEIQSLLKWYSKYRHHLKDALV